MNCCIGLLYTCHKCTFWYPQEETSSLQDFTPVSQKRSLKCFTSCKSIVMYYLLTKGPEGLVRIPLSLLPGLHFIAVIKKQEVEAIARPRRKKLRKSQISGPVELVVSSALNI